MTNTYQLGNVVSVSTLFTNQAQPPAPVDPTTITLKILDPTGTETDYVYGVDPIVKNGVGSYSYSFEPLIAGYWNYRWEGAGAVEVAGETRFLVSQSAFTSPQ